VFDSKETVVTTLLMMYEGDTSTLLSSVSGKRN